MVVGWTPYGSEATPLSRLDGEIRVDAEALGFAADDFGHLVHHRPAAVLTPASARDVAGAIRWAAGNGRQVAARGRAHSVYGRSQVSHGVVVDMSGLGAVHDVQRDRVMVDAGATWREVLAATLPSALTPPVLPEYLDLSVGGTLAVGGVGATSSGLGVQSDHVLDLQVVTGRGETLTCSPRSSPELFDAVRAGLGQVAVAVRATLRLVPTPERIRRFLLFYPDLATMLGDARLLAAYGRFDAVQGAVLAAPSGVWTFRLDVAVGLSGHSPDDATLLGGLRDNRSLRQPSTLPYADYLSRFDGLERALRADDRWSCAHPWLTTFVGDATVEAVVAAELARLDPIDPGPPFGQVVLSPLRRRAVTSPLLQLPADGLCYAFNLIRLPATDSVDAIDRLVAANRETYERVRVAGGTIYPASAAVPMSGGDWERHFGPAFAAFQRAKLTYDPDHVLTPGYEVFGRSE